MSLQRDGPIGQMRFEAKEHADKCLAQRDPDTNLCTFRFKGQDESKEEVAVPMKLEVLHGDEEKEAWRSFRASVAARSARESGGRGRGGRGLKRART